MFAQNIITQALIAPGVLSPHRAARSKLNSILRSDGLTVADYDASLGVTGTLNASAWANQIGAAGPLLQAIGANQPIVLPFTGEKYAYLPGVAGNYFSSPDSVAASVTGDIDIRVCVAMNDWTPSSDMVLVSKYAASSQQTFSFQVQATTGVLRMVVSANGSVDAAKDSTQAPGVADGAAKWLRVVVDVDNGAGGWDVIFYTSDDGVSWNQIGTTVTTATPTSLFDSTAPINIGQVINVAPLSGKIYRAQIHNGIGGTLAVDFNASDWSETSTNGATQASSTTGEVWTLNNTGAKPAQIVGSSSLLFDGTDDFMKALFTLNSPVSIYLVGKQVSWTINERFFSGGTALMDLIQDWAGVSPNLGLSAQPGAGYRPISGPALNTYATMTTVFNGASSVFKYDQTADQAGDVGNGTTFGGFTLAEYFDGVTGVFGNIQVKRVIIRSVADSASTRAQMQGLLRQIYGTP